MIATVFIARQLPVTAGRSGSKIQKAPSETEGYLGHPGPAADRWHAAAAPSRHDIGGTWQGTLSGGQQTRRVVIQITKARREP